MPALDPQRRSLIARIAAEQSHANTADPTARTAPARAAMLARFEDPNITDPSERARRAEHAKRAYFLGLALKSADARRKKAAVRDLRAAAAVDLQLADQLESS